MMIDCMNTSDIWFQTNSLCAQKVSYDPVDVYNRGIKSIYNPSNGRRLKSVETQVKKLNDAYKDQDSDEWWYYVRYYYNILLREDEAALTEKVNDAIQALHE